MFFWLFCLIALVFFIAGCYVGGSKVGAELGKDLDVAVKRAEAAEARVKSWGAQANAAKTPSPVAGAQGKG